MKRVRWLHIICLVLLSISGYGQSRSDTILSRERWEELTKKLDYGEVSERPEQPDKPPPPEPVDGNGATALRILLFILAGAGIAILIAMLLGVGKPKDKKLKEEQIDISSLEEDLPGTELDSYLDQALRQEDYRLAVRLHYLRLLQVLTEHNHIHWKPDKTNREYLLETAEHTWHDEFRTLTNLFERIRYGRLPLDRPTYEAVRARFAGLHQRFAPQKTARV